MKDEKLALQAPSARRSILAMMDDILRFPSAVRHDPAIDVWLGSRRDDLRPLAEAWFLYMRQLGGDVRELMHDGCPTACVGDAAFGYVTAFKDHVNVGFFFGALCRTRQACWREPASAGAT